MLYTVCLLKKTADYSETEVTYIMLVAGASVFIILAFLEAGVNGTIGTLLALPFVDSGFFIAILFQGIGCSIFAFFLSNVAILKIGVNRTSSFIGISTVVSVIGGILILHEQFSFWQLVGAVIIIAGVYIANAYLGSVHIEVEDTMEVSEFDALSRRIQEVITEKFGIFISAVGVYSINTKDEKAIAIREAVQSVVLDIQYVKQMHGFYLDDKSMRFDVVISFEAKDRSKVYQKVIETIQDKYPEYTINVGMDMVYNEL